MYVPVHPDDANALDRYHVETYSANGRHPNHHSIFRLLHDLQVQKLMSSPCTLDQCQYYEDVSVLVVVEDEDMVHTPERILVVALKPYEVASAEREAVVRLPAGMNKTLAWAHCQAMSNLCLPRRDQCPSQNLVLTSKPALWGNPTRRARLTCPDGGRGGGVGTQGYGSGDLVRTCR